MDKLKHTDVIMTQLNTSTHSSHWIECMCEQCEQLGYGMFSKQGETNDRE